MVSHESRPFNNTLLSTPSVNRNLSLIKSDTPYNQLHQNFSYLDTDKLWYSI